MERDEAERRPVWATLTAETPLDPAADGLCRSLYRTFPGGVSVVTVAAAEGAVGLTVSSLVSVSLDPPLLLVSIARGSRTLDVLLTEGRFAVNVLRDDQEQLARRFAQSTPGWAKFHGVPLIDERPPVLAGVGAAAVCDLHEAVPAGDHVLVIGSVRSAFVGLGRPLIWHGSRFRRLSEPDCLRGLGGTDDGCW